MAIASFRLLLLRIEPRGRRIWLEVSVERAIARAFWAICAINRAFGALPTPGRGEVITLRGGKR